jgi:hypothetical protein
MLVIAFVNMEENVGRLKENAVRGVAVQEIRKNVREVVVREVVVVMDLDVL